MVAHFLLPRDLPYSEIKPAYLENGERKQETIDEGLCEAKEMKGFTKNSLKHLIPGQIKYSQG